MQYRLRIASSAFVLLVAAAAAQACGHLPFDDLPEIADGSVLFEAGPLADSSSGGADSALRDATTADGDAERDADADADVEDAFVRDGAVPDAACLTSGDCRVIYVSPLTGKKDNPGTADEPVDSIDAGLALVTKLRNELHIASGHYLGPIKLTGERDVLLYGGFKCEPSDCAWGKDNQETVVTATDLVGGALYIGAGHGRGTVISGIHFKGAQGIIGGDAAGAVTVSVIGSTPVLQHLTVDGPLSSGGSSIAARRSVAVLVSGKQDDPRGVSIDDCAIAGGTADTQASGILVEDGPTALNGASPVLDLTASVVTGGTAPFTYAVLLSSSGPNTKIHENEKIQGVPAYQQAAVTESWAISATGNVEISRNIVNGSNQGSEFCKNAQTLCGGILLNNASGKVVNNIVHGVAASASAALVLAMSANHTPTVIVNSNVLDGGGNSSSDGYSAAVFVKNTNATDGTIGFVRNNILLGGDNKSSYGVAELDDNAVAGHLAAFDHNDVRADTAYHAWYPAPTATSKNFGLFDLKNAPVSNASDASTNIGDDCLLDSTFHLGQHSPCINAGTKVEAPDVDIDGDARPNPPGSANGWDIGADESPFATP